MVLILLSVLKSTSYSQSSVRNVMAVDCFRQLIKFIINKQIHKVINKVNQAKNKNKKT